MSVSWVMRAYAAYLRPQRPLLLSSFLWSHPCLFLAHFPLEALAGQAVVLLVLPVVKPGCRVLAAMLLRLQVDLDRCGLPGQSAL